MMRVNRVGLNDSSGAGVPPAVVASFAYAYDLAGNRMNMTTLEGVNHYTYNANNWLIGVEYPDDRVQEFEYDAVGNRTLLQDTGGSSSSTTYDYDNANRLLSAVSAVETNDYYYDGAGRLTNQVVNGVARTYAYSFRSQMTSLVDTDAVTRSYSFDGDGNRTKEVMPGPDLKYVYDGPNVVLEVDNINAMYAAYVHAPGIDQPIEKIFLGESIPGLDRRAVYHADGLGSVAAMTDSTGALIKEYRYEAFGKLRYEDGPGPLGGNRYTFTARESVGDSAGFLYYRWRVMDPNTGRFTSEDPLGFAGGDFNLYRYVGNNPILLVDPNGEALVPLLIALAEVTWGATCRHYAVENALATFPEDDKKQHCFASCWFNRCMGLVQPGISFLGGIIHELRNPNYGWDDAVRDIRANIRGIIGSYSFSSCKDVCDKCKIE